MTYIVLEINLRHRPSTWIQHEVDDRLYPFFRDSGLTPSQLIDRIPKKWRWLVKWWVRTSDEDRDKTTLYEDEKG